MSLANIFEDLLWVKIERLMKKIFNHRHPSSLYILDLREKRMRWFSVRWDWLILGVLSQVL